MFYFSFVSYMFGIFICDKYIPHISSLFSTSSDIHHRVSINTIASSSLMNQLSYNTNKHKNWIKSISANHNTNIYPTSLNHSIQHQTADIPQRVSINIITSSSLMNLLSFSYSHINFFVRVTCMFSLCWYKSTVVITIW